VESRIVTAVMVALVVALAAAATLGPFVAAAAVGVAAVVLLMAVAGRERTATVFMAAAFATAPMYRGLVADIPATPTDLLIVIAVVLLLPELFSRQARLPTVFLLALAVLVALGLRGAAVSSAPFESLLLLGVWMMCLGVLPIVIAMWNPGRGVVHLLLWSYLAGHAASILAALAEGPLVNNRYDGLTHHPNAFGIAGAISITIVFYLWPRYPQVWVRVALAGIAAASAASVLMSGSRAATLVVVAVVVLVPLVERSAVAGLALAAGVGIGVAFLPFIVEASGEGSSISRLVGDGTAEFSDNLRDQALEDGQDRFAEAPIFGSGLTIDLGEIHNVYLEVGIAVGIIGLVAYFALLWVLARPLLSSHPDRRLAYFVWVFVIIGPVVPGLTDRTMLLPMALAILPAVGLMGREPDTPSALPAARAGADA
jgi:O-antigen ligase